jgi:hypothetical protein
MKKIAFLFLLSVGLLAVGCTPPGTGDLTTPGDTTTTPATPSPDPIIGLWTRPADEGSGEQFIAARSDGSWVSGQMSADGYSSQTVMGTWSRFPTGYTILTYQTDGASFSPWPFTGWISSDKTELTVTGLIDGSPILAVFTRHASPGVDSLPGLWTLSSAPDGSSVAAQAISISADGSWTCGQIMSIGDGRYQSATIAGTWVKNGSTYTMTAYQSPGDDTPGPMTIDGTLSGGTFTVDTPDGAYEFSRQSSPGTDPATGMWVISAVTDPPSQHYPVSGALSVSADGSWISGQIQYDGGDAQYSSAATVGTWEIGPGSYTISVYEASGPGTGLPMEIIGSISTDGTMFTLEVPWGGDSPMHVVYTKM